MKNLSLLNKVIERTNLNFQKESRKSFNTNDFLLEVLLDKEIEREEVIDIILNKRLELEGYTEKYINSLKEDSKEMKELVEKVIKLRKTSKNGLDTSVSDSNNNSSFSYNQKYEDYKLIKKGSKLSIVKK